MLLHGCVRVYLGIAHPLHMLQICIIKNHTEVAIKAFSLAKNLGLVMCALRQYVEA